MTTISNFMSTLATLASLVEVVTADFIRLDLPCSFLLFVHLNRNSDLFNAHPQTLRPLLPTR